MLQIAQVHYFPSRSYDKRLRNHCQDKIVGDSVSHSIFNL